LKFTRRESVTIAVEQSLPTSLVAVNKIAPVLGDLCITAEILVVEM